MEHKRLSLLFALCSSVRSLSVWKTVSKMSQVATGNGLLLAGDTAMAGGGSLAFEAVGWCEGL